MGVRGLDSPLRKWACGAVRWWYADLTSRDTWRYIPHGGEIHRARGIRLGESGNGACTPSLVRYARMTDAERSRR
ncbi:unnamed protein product [Fusarium graminearum]|nr:unnamed protein product [Fusarium graminearum]